MNDGANNDLGPPAILGIEVEKLFGHYSYHLFPKRPETQHQLLLLYGDNGSGKSTLSQLVFHALSREDGRGHRSFLAETRFRSFSIHFSTGAVLKAERLKEELEGPYRLIATDGKGTENRVDVRTSEDGAVHADDVSEEDLRAVLNTCLPASQSVYYLSDNRVLQSDDFDDEPTEEWISRQGRIVTRHLGDSVQRMLVPSRRRDLTVGPSVLRAEGWLRRQVIDASTEGELTTSNIYSEIVRRIAQAQAEAPDHSLNRLAAVKERLASLAERTKDFSSFGLAQPVALEPLTTHLVDADKDTQELLASVLEPYVNSIQSRLDAFATVQKRLSVFVEIMNSFYRRKYVRITASDGIQVFDSNDGPLDVNLLSSGEKQLMLLLCNILCATTQPSVFIIDEPELSLNVKWQRDLVDSLLSLCAGSHVQFLMATHSIELLTRHKDAVLKLDDIGAE